MNKPLIECRQLSKSYRDGKTSVDVLKSIDFSIYQSDRVAIVGPSGSGKSTFLHLLGGLDNPTCGKICINGIDWMTTLGYQKMIVNNLQYSLHCAPTTTPVLNQSPFPAHPPSFLEQ